MKYILYVIDDIALPLIVGDSDKYNLFSIIVSDIGMMIIDVSLFIEKDLRHSTFSITDKIVISNNQSVITLYMSVLNETQYSQMKSLGAFEIQVPLFIHHTTFFI